jgi:enoyl-CoA hydratase/carnithine racemase
MEDMILYEQHGHVVTLTINRPAQMNALNTTVRQGLFDGFERFERDADARVAILTGAGDRAFCAGMDLKEAAEMALAVPPRGFLPILGDTIHVTKPVIAAVNGVAFAGGWLLAQMCDLCIASESATFGITEARVGRGMGWAPPLIHMIPQRVMLELLMTAKPITAQRAYEIGFVNHVVAPDQVLPRAREMAADIVANAPLTVAAVKEMMMAATDMGRSAALRAGANIFEKVYLSEDAIEGPKAFREKRRPNWKGK